MESEFTPGPWTTKPHPSNGKPVVVQDSLNIRGKRDIICLFPLSGDEGINNANAELIAASPNLFECLSKLVEGHKVDNTKDMGFWLEIAEKHLNKLKTTKQ